MLCIIVFLTNYNDFVNLIAVFLLYFLLPLFLLEFSCKKTVYLCMFNVGLLSLLNCIFNMIIILFYSKQFDNVLSYLLINLIVTFIVIIVLSIRSIRLSLREFYSSSKQPIRTIILIAVWSFFILTTLITLIIETNIKLGISLSIIILSLLGVSIAVLAYLIASNKKKQFYENAAATLEENMKNQIRHYEEKQKMYDEGGLS